ncbi:MULTISPECIES: DUF2127 domain-containing protein [Burkholderia cepacia complex]|uniref:DUF2127 domain-containing protein n=1 Tax=Burkholderia cepacia complex TaxID=87882 RepID=UPI00097C3F27|nr:MULTISPECIES: DUF2127 domain-containing protein [Burkholderia cepacia complex]AQQ48122.1 hypothetical protein A8F32_19865 [Burkholderia cenocepacia]ONJ04166.1 hypothetical protein A8F33_23660 [Burkholderia cenocepacia]ONJ09564.1 hypothetical protein A8F53_00930 [Burkholderia cenocepacia]ONJ29305.1 hypothetical protein A8F38_17595 [Burkholderia cenocepacia]ONY69125.1 hypothetical protein A8F36_32795 [Burkholderia cenocepacia]
MNALLDEKKLHLIFDASLWIKAAFALSEVLAGVIAYFVKKQFLTTFVVWVTRNEFAEDPHDLVANILLHAIQHLSVGTQRFAALYLLAHGIVKLWLITGLLRQRLWYYPTSIGILGLFIAYQLYRFSFTHAGSLLLITMLDVAIIVLTLHEYRFLRREKMLTSPSTNATRIHGDRLVGQPYRHMPSVAKIARTKSQG